MSEEAFQRVRLLGFAGHRKIGSPAEVKNALRREIATMAGVMDGEVIGISSAAAGADLLFLEACAEAGMKTVVILPFRTDRFSEDFDDAGERERALKLIEAAHWHEVAPGNEEAPEAYHVVSRRLLEVSDQMLFLWDGQAPRGVGGTGETVREAGELGLTSRIIHADTLEARWQVHPGLPAAADAVFHDLPRAATVESLFHLLDSRAIRAAPRSRWFNASSMSVNHVSTFLQGGFLILGVAKDAGGLVKFGLAMVAAILPGVGAKLKLQQGWATDRVKAELLRSLLASHEPASPLHPPAAELFNVEASFLRSAAFALIPHRLGWEQARDHYVTERIDGQSRYFRNQAEKTGWKLRLFQGLFRTFSIAAVLFSILVIWNGFSKLPVSERWQLWALGFLPIVLPGLAAWCLAMISAFQLRRRANLYKQLAEELERMRHLVQSAVGSSEVAAGMARCERMLLNELWEWRGALKK